MWAGIGREQSTPLGKVFLLLCGLEITSKQSSKLRMMDGEDDLVHEALASEAL